MTVDSATPDPVTITKTCRLCGVAFTYPRSRGHGQRRYCSAACRNAATVEQMQRQRAARYSQQPYTCRHCGAVTDPAPAVGRPKSVYCSTACKEAHRAARQKAERMARHAGRSCRQCGGPIPLGLSTRAVTCSRSCGVQYQNTVRSERARLARSQRPRPPCRVCGSAIDPARRRNVVYCSEACKRIAVATKYRSRNPDVGVYGMHICLNVVVGPPGQGAAILLRAVEPLEGIASMRAARLARAVASRRAAATAPAAEAGRIARLPVERLAAGPANLGAAFEVELGEDGHDLLDPAGSLRLEPGPANRPGGEIIATARVGVAYAGPGWADRPWRFVMAGRPAANARP